jgi:hypothetical protein
VEQNCRGGNLVVVVVAHPHINNVAAAAAVLLPPSDVVAAGVLIWGSSPLKLGGTAASFTVEFSNCIVSLTQQCRKLY